MNHSLFLFCGGPSIYEGKKPKPLMTVLHSAPLLIHFLKYLINCRKDIPNSITLLCDDGQESLFSNALEGFIYPTKISIVACGKHSSTFEKFEKALTCSPKKDSLLHFCYPDIFFLGEHLSPFHNHQTNSNTSLYISTAPLISRFPRLIVDIFNNHIKGISNYRSLVPANPMHVFGGDIWGQADLLIKLIHEFKSNSYVTAPSLEYDFFFWLINRNNIECVMQYGEMVWIDSAHDFQNLLVRMGDAS